LLDEPAVRAFAPRLGDAAVKHAVDGTLAAIRRSVLDDPSAAPSTDALLASVLVALARREAAGVLPVINATGILLHTNLGRAPLADEALAAMAAVGGGYANLEFDLDRGVRGSRYERVSDLLRDVTGAEDALIVNNCAAAVLLILDTYAKGREVIVSRNQLIEIGGGFRLPDVLRRSGATLVEVGATNKVYLADFRRALSPRTALLMRSHTSNYRIEGFTADVSASELAAFGKQVGVPTVEDLGSGTLVDLRAYGLPYERTVPEVVADGIALTAFSGDKLLGGPQCGIIVGTRTAIARLRTNPLLRALRVDKATIAALAATLRLYATGSVTRIPFYRMLAATPESLRLRAQALATTLAGRYEMHVHDVGGYVGGGALPQAVIPSVALVVKKRGTAPNALAARLREARPPLIGRVEDNLVLLDLRTVPPERDADVRDILIAAS
jgi:L-seryl-tRNA(Ser) seleniumtransferase